MKLFERNGILYANFKQKGKRIKKSLHMADTPANRKYALEKVLPTLLKTKTRQRQNLGEFLNIILEEAKEKKHSTYKTYESARLQILNYFEPSMHISDIKTSDVDEFIRELSRSKLAPKTIKTYLSPLALAFNEAIRLDIIEKNPVTNAKKPKARTKEKEVFTKEEIVKLLTNAKGELKIFLLIAFYTGARAGEIIALKWSDIKDDRMTISKTRSAGYTDTPKSGRSRTFKIPKALLEYLSKLERKSPFVVGKEFTYINTIADAFERLQEELGIEYRSLHTTRHTTISLLLAAGENPMLIKNMVGHVDMKMIETVYGHYIQDDRDLVAFETQLGLKREHAA